MVKGMKPSLELTLLQYHVFDCLYQVMKNVLGDERFRIKLSSTKITRELKEKNIYTHIEIHHVANALRELKAIGLIRQIEDVLRTEGQRGSKPELTWELNESLFDAHTIVVVDKCAHRPSTAVANPSYKHPQVVPAKKTTRGKPTKIEKKKKQKKNAAKTGKRNAADVSQAQAQTNPLDKILIAKNLLGEKMGRAEELNSVIAKLQKELNASQEELSKLNDEIQRLKPKIEKAEEAMSELLSVL